MQSVEAPWAKPVSFELAQREKWSSFALVGLLSAYTLTTLDGGEIPSRIISAVLLLATAAFFLFRPVTAITISLPVICLLLMTGYGIVQTLWFRQKITYDGWSGVLFWFTAAAITWWAAQILRDRRRATLFRQIFVLFGSGLCILELLEQASRTNKYFWTIPSKYELVYGSFAYWNNFAQFVELLLPVTLAMAVGQKKPDFKYVLLAALQIGAVAASGSRAGVALVLGEVVTILLLAYFRNRDRAFLYVSIATLILSAVFVYAAGTTEVVRKFEQNDQLSVRRDVNKSSWAMIKERPLTGWGLETYVSVYPMFARMDAGNFVNRAHNDWFQWTAEGGVLFSSLMLVVFVWSIRPAVMSLWGIGLVAVCLHAVVDYPFARLGVCGWYFGLLGMLSVWRPGEKSVKRRRRSSRAERPSLERGADELGRYLDR